MTSKRKPTKTSGFLHTGEERNRWYKPSYRGRQGGRPTIKTGHKKPKK